MGRIGQALNVDPWAAHSAGLFEECGKAVMFRHASDRYRPMLAKAESDEELLMLEHAEFGVSHDTLGAALCESWGVRRAGGRQRALPRDRQHARSSCRCRSRGARSARCRRWRNALMTDPETVDEVARKVAPQAGLDAAAGRSARRAGCRSRSKPPSPVTRRAVALAGRRRPNSISAAGA